MYFEEPACARSSSRLHDTGMNRAELGDHVTVSVQRVAHDLAK